MRKTARTMRNKQETKRNENNTTQQKSRNKKHHPGSRARYKKNNVAIAKTQRNRKKTEPVSSARAASINSFGYREDPAIISRARSEERSAW